MEYEFESSCWISCIDRSLNSIQNLELLSRNHLENVTCESELKITNFVLKLGMHNTSWLGQCNAYTKCFFLIPVSHMPSLSHAFQVLPFLPPYVFFVPSLFIYLSTYTVLPAVEIIPINPKCCSAVSNPACYSRSSMEAEEEMLSQLM